MDFNGTVLRPAYMGAIQPMMAKRFKKTELTSEQQQNIKEAFMRTIPYAFKRLERSLLEKNKEGIYGTSLKCPISGENIPSIADYQLFCEFIDFEYFKKGELDHFSLDIWGQKHPRLKIWYDALKSDQNEEALKWSKGLR